VRAFFGFLIRRGLVEINVARLIHTPKAPQKLPRIMTAEQVNTLLDEIAAGKLERPHAARDLAIFELLYGCGLRISELTGFSDSNYFARQFRTHMQMSPREYKQLWTTDRS